MPETRYTESGEVSIAYQAVGEGPLDLVYVPGWVSNVELLWEGPKAARFLRRLASFSRLILFDKRGTGLSDRVSNDRLPTLEERMDDVRAVLDAVGSERAALLGHSEGGSMSMLFAATSPERVSALVLVGVFAKRIRSDDYPWAPAPEDRAAAIESVGKDWLNDSELEYYAPSEDAVFREHLRRFFRQSASPGAARALLTMNSEIDTRAVLPSITVPTIVIHRTDDRDVSADEGRWIADRIPGRDSSSCPAKTTSSGPVTRTRCSARSSSSSPERATRPTSTACSRRCSSRTSSTRPLAPRRSATGGGTT